MAGVTRKVVTVRFEGPRHDSVDYRQLVHDDKKVFEEFGTVETTADGQRLLRRSDYSRPGRRFATRAAAQEHFDALVSKYARQERWTHTHRSEEELAANDGIGVVAENPELEAQLIATPDAEDVARVYADWLQAHDDARGELAALLQSGRGAEAKAWMAANASRLLGDVDVHLANFDAVYAEIYGFRFQQGFLKSVSLRRSDFESKTDLAALTRTFLALPIARFITSLRFGLARYNDDNDWTETMLAIAAWPRARQLKQLLFSDYEYDDNAREDTPFGDFSRAWPALVGLEELHIRAGRGTLGAIELPALRTFVRETGGLAGAELQDILRARWPRLEWLELWLGCDYLGGECTVEQLDPLLTTGAPATLTHLGLVNAEIAHELIEPLAKSPLLPRLRSLGLSKGVLCDEDVDLLLRHAPAFAHLQRLDLRENQLGERAQEIVVALPNALVGKQRALDEGERCVADLE
jgi:hypothetical protein